MVKRSTIKDNISLPLSLEMINMLDYIIILFAVNFNNNNNKKNIYKIKYLVRMHIL